jgi:hypothetical protein
MPGVKADLRIATLYHSSAPWPRLFESLPPLGLALLVFWKTRSFSDVWPCYAYIGYLLLDLLVIPQRRLAKWIRNSSAAAFTLVYGNWVLPKIGLPEVPGAGALLAVLAGATFPYLYERGRVALDFLQGIVLAALLSLGAQYLVPTGLGPHVTLPLFAAAYAWERRTVFWRYTAPVLAAYALFVPLWLGGDAELLPHAVAGLVAWLLVRFFSREPSREEAAESVSTESALGLLDDAADLEESEPASPSPARDRASHPRRGSGIERSAGAERPKGEAPKRPPPPGLLDW